MELNRYKEVLMIIQEGNIKIISNDELDVVLQHLTQMSGDDNFNDVSTLPDGSTLFNKMVLNTVLREKAKRGVQQR